MPPELQTACHCGNTLLGTASEKGRRGWSPPPPAPPPPPPLPSPSPPPPPQLTPTYLHAKTKRGQPPPAGAGTTSVNPDSVKWNRWPGYCTVPHTDAFDRQLIRIHTQCSPQSEVIMSVGNWPADSDMIPAPVVTRLNNEITIEWQTWAPQPPTLLLSPCTQGGTLPFQKNWVPWRQKIKNKSYQSEELM